MFLTGKVRPNQDQSAQEVSREQEETRGLPEKEIQAWTKGTAERVASRPPGMQAKRLWRGLRNPTKRMNTYNHHLYSIILGYYVN